jgi:hypothetical protein
MVRECGVNVGSRGRPVRPVAPPGRLAALFARYGTGYAIAGYIFVCAGTGPRR